MKYQNLFSWKNKKNIINLSSAEIIMRVVKVKSSKDKINFVIQKIWIFFLFIHKNIIMLWALIEIPSLTTYIFIEQ